MGTGEEKSIREGEEWRKDERGEPTLMVVSSEDVISFWPSWLNWHQKTVLVCPSKVANTFPVGTSSTWRAEAKQTSAMKQKRISLIQTTYIFYTQQTDEILLLPQSL